MVEGVVANVVPCRHGLTGHSDRLGHHQILAHDEEGGGQLKLGKEGQKSPHTQLKGRRNQGFFVATPSPIKPKIEIERVHIHRDKEPRRKRSFAVHSDHHVCQTRPRLTLDSDRHKELEQVTQDIGYPLDQIDTRSTLFNNFHGQFQQSVFFPLGANHKL